MKESNHRPLKCGVSESGIAGSAESRDTDEQTDSSKTDSRDTASPSQRTSVGARPSTSTDGRDEDNADDDTVLVCPECDKTNIRAMVGSGFGVSADHDNDYYCRECTHHFDDPVERERGHTSDGRAYLARELVDADPEDVSADHVGEPMTDGGADVDLQIASRLRDLADEVEVHGLEGGDIAVDGDEATIVETVALEPASRPAGGDR